MSLYQEGKIDSVLLKRMSDESFETYNFRVCKNKDLGLYDLTWKDVSDILNEESGELYNESKWRKDYQIISKYIENNTEMNADSEELVEKLRLAKLELDIAKKQVQTENVFNNKIVREHSRKMLQSEKIVDAIKLTSKIEIPIFDKLQESVKGKSEYLLAISDIHAYKNFKSITNSYSKAELEERMSMLMNDMKELIIEQNISELTICN